MKLLLMWNSLVGQEIAEWLLENYPDDMVGIVVTQEHSLCDAARERNIPFFIFESEEQLLSDLCGLVPFDLGVLAWWPKIISPALISLASEGFINTHPSLLPYNRGKHYNFWAIVEQAPFGVSLHFVDEGVDSGDIVAQTPIAYNWEDTGETLYRKASYEMVRLFKSTYPQIRSGGISRAPQNISRGSLHFAKEIDVASKINLDQNYTARDLINLMRARTFPGHPACYFEDNGEIFEINVNIKRKSE